MKSKLKISFQLKPGEVTNIQVLAFVSYGYKEYDPMTKKFIYKPVIVYTGMKTEKDEWDKWTKLPFDSHKKAQLESIRRDIEKVYEHLSYKGEFTRDQLKEEIQKKLKGEEAVEMKVVQRVRLVDFINQEILTSTDLDESTKPPYKGFRNKLLLYEKKIGKMIYSNDVNKELYLDFMDGMKERLKKINAVWSIQKIFKSVLNKIAAKYKIKVFSPADELERTEKVRSEVPDNIYLSMDHIKKVIAKEPQDEKMRNIKFILMILLFTGCRESDVYKIIPNKSFKGKTDRFNYAQFIPEKTETEVIVPILKPLQEMFDKNGGNPPEKVTQQTFNKKVKEFILSCRLKEEVTMSFTNAKGKRELVTKKFYQWVSSHTGRRSFITNLINFIPLPILTKITGHKLADKEIIFAYNKITLLENAALFRKLLKRVITENKEYFPIPLL